MTVVSRIGLGCSLILLAVGVPASAQNTTTRVSVAGNGAQGTADSYLPAVSPDGRYVVFASKASNLVPNDTNNYEDVFLRDRQAGTIERVNLGPGGIQAEGAPGPGPGTAPLSYPVVSADGRFVAFTSAATNLVSGDTNDAVDVFVRDRQTGTTTRVNVPTGGGQATGGSSFGSLYGPLISADGRFVAFTSGATNLVPGENSGEEAYLHDRQTGTTVRLDVDMEAHQFSSSSSMTPDGRYVVFIAHFFGAPQQVYVRDRQAGTTTLVSVNSSGVKTSNGATEATISDDGRFVAFVSNSTNLGDDYDVFVHDRQTGGTSSLGLFPSSVMGLQFPDSLLHPVITGDGRFVCYTRRKFQPSQQSVVLFDRQTQLSTVVDATPNGNPSGHDSAVAPLCAPNTDGSVIAFSSGAPNLVATDTNNASDLFVRTLSVLSSDKSTLSFAAMTSGGTFVSQTGPQSVQLIQQRDAPLAWTATPSQPWLQIIPASGTGSGTLSIRVAPAAGLPSSGTVTATISFAIGGGVTLAPITVTLTLVPAATTTGPFGVVETPTDNRTGVTGAVPFTGWALDDIEVARVSICRAAFGAEVAPIDPNCGGAAEIFVGFALFVDGARPDVAAAYPAYPQPTRGGWGFMLLTNMLPGHGNGTYVFRMRAQDREGNWLLLGTRTMTCANASATLPFGTIDTPLQGGVVSGTSYVNFGWVLTPQPKTVRDDAILVLIDGASIGTVDYKHARSDIQAAFPGYNDTNGAVGFHVFDTTRLANGTHTISWLVFDSQGASDGIGSRYFTVANGIAGLTAASSAASAHVDLDALPHETTSLAGRRGWDVKAPYGLFSAGADGVTVIRGEEVSRIELRLGDGEYTGHLRTSRGLAPLPIGSRLDAATNTFTWAPGVAFVGPYDLVFVRSLNGRPVSRREVRIILHPKGRGSVGPQVVIDIPSAGTAVSAPFMMGGWAADLDAGGGTGVTTLHAWAYPASGGAPIFLGATEYGGARPDVAAVHGAQFKDSGFGLIVQGLAAGDYDLALFAWSTETMNFVAPKMVRVSVVP